MAVEDQQNGADHRHHMVWLARAASRVRVDLPLAALDVMFVVASYVFVLILRRGVPVPVIWWHHFEVFAPIACVVHLVVTGVCGGYGRSWRYASIEEAQRLILAGLISLTVLVTSFGWGDQRMPLSVLIFGALLATCIQGAFRFQSRLFAFRRAQEEPGGLRVVVIGAGKTGAAVLREMRQNRHLGFVPVAVLDDDPSLHRRSLHGVPVVGGIDRLTEIIHDDDVQLVLLAVHSEDGDVAKRVADGTNGSGVPVRVVRGAHYWVHGAPLQHLRELRIEDLLGRVQVDIDLEPVRRLLHGRRVLVTGGGGWIGAEIARQVATFDPALLVLLDHDETHLHDASYGLEGVRTVLADVRDFAVIQRVFDDVRPEVVFHAAAHKHVPILERHPCEAVRTNVLGTSNVVNAAALSGTRHFVYISTDKAAQPTNVMAASKWLAEQIVLARTPPDASYCSVRFGNVLASRGSVIPTFQRQIDAGGPVTVTDPAMTRFFMSTDEAVCFVLHAAGVASGAGVLAFDMGERVNIYELAERMIRLSGLRAGHDIEIEIIGRRPGENLTESVVGPDETASPCGDAGLIAIVPVPFPEVVLDETVERLRKLEACNDDDGARELLLSTANLAARACPA